MDNSNFELFCINATDNQLENILLKEYKSGRRVDYLTAKAVAYGRGWIVDKGQRVY